MAGNNLQGAPGQFCHNCGAPVEPGSHFCPKCGDALDPAQTAAAVTPVAPVYAAAPPAAYPPQGAWVAPQAAPPVSAPKSAGGGKCLLYGIIGIVAAIVLACLGGGGYAFVNRDTLFAPAVPPTATPTATVPATVTPTVTATRTAAPSATATATSTAAPSATATRPPTATATRTAAATATATRTATATAKPSATVTRTPTSLPGSILMMDDFSSLQKTTDNGWSLDTGADVDYIWTQGKFNITVKQPDYLGSTWPNGTYTDFGAEVVAQSAASSAGDYGMIFRVSGTSASRSYYLFGVNTDGQYFVWAKVNGQWQDIDPVPATASSLIKPAGNTLGVIAKGSQISLYINRTLAKTFTNSLIAGEGKIGIYVGSGTSSSMYAASFTRYTVMTPDRAPIEWAKAP